MLTDEQKYANQMKYIELLSRLNIDLTNITAYLNNINYFDAPATTQYNGSYAGGLCEQALKVCFELGQLCNAYYPNKYTEADIIKVALLKDVYRAELYEPYQKNVKNDQTGQWEQIGAYKNKDQRPVYGDLGFSSYMAIRNLIQLTDEQIEAIVQNSTLNNFSVDIHEIYKQYPLVTLTKMAELAAVYINK